MTCKFLKGRILIPTVYDILKKSTNVLAIDYAAHSFVLQRLYLYADYVTHILFVHVHQAEKGTEEFFFNIYMWYMLVIR